MIMIMMMMMMMKIKVDNDIFGAVENAADNDNPEEEVGCDTLGRAFERTNQSQGVVNLVQSEDEFVITVYP